MKESDILKEKLKEELATLSEEAKQLPFLLLSARKANSEKPLFSEKYQSWYTKALLAIKQMLPDRYDEFVECYAGSKKRNEINSENYSISDFCKGSYIGYSTIGDLLDNKLITQINILNSSLTRCDSLISNIKGILEAKLFDDEIDEARQLLKNGYYRAAGIISGVVLERHFDSIIDSRGLIIAKKNPTISDFNDFLRDNNIIDLIQWRLIQRLGDIRNLCGHNKEREPLPEEVEDLISGVDKIIKTLF